MYRGSEPREGVVLCEFREVGSEPGVRVTRQEHRGVEFTIGSHFVVDVLHTAQRVQKASYGVPLVLSAALVVDGAP